MAKLRPVALAAGIAAIALSTAACSGTSGNATKAASNPNANSTAAPTATVSLSETGSTLLYPLFNLWDPSYHQQHSNITVTAQGTGSGTGISQASAGAVNIGASDAYLSPGQVQKSPGLLNIPLAISAQQINYNLPGVKGNLKLDGALLSAMYQGKITKWNDPQIAAANPGVALPATKVVPLHRSDGSGDTFLFTQYLSKQDPNGWGNAIGFGTTVSFPAVAGALGEHGNGGMVSGCQATPGCVAYIGISFLDQATKAGLGEAQLKNASGNYELPTQATIQAEAAGFANSTPANGAISLINGPAAGGYPIINYEYAIVNKQQANADTAQAVRAFLSWAIDPAGGNAASFLDQVHFQPLPSAVQTISQHLLSQVS